MRQTLSGLSLFCRYRVYQLLASHDTVPVIRQLIPSPPKKYVMRHEILHDVVKNDVINDRLSLSCHSPIGEWHRHFAINSLKI